MNNQPVVLKNAFYIALAMVIYFFLTRSLGLDNLPKLRLVNLLFIALGINNAIKHNILYNYETNYKKNLLVGIYASILAAVIGLLSLSIYVSFVQPNFIKVLQNTFFIWKNDFSLPLIIGYILLEAIIVSVLFSFLVMLYWKNHKIEN